MNRKPQMLLNKEIVIWPLLCLIPWINFTACQKPNKPTGVDLLEGYSSPFVIKWNVEVGQSYIVKAIPTAVGGVTNCYGGEENAISPFTFTKVSDGTLLQPRTKYDIGICAGSIPDPAPNPPESQVSMSDPTSIVRIETGPSPPTNVRVSNTAANEISVEWDDDDDAKDFHPVIQYTVYYKPTGSTDDELSKQTDAVAVDDSANRDKFITITGLQSNTEYTISVVSVTSNPIKTSDRSSSINGTTIPLPPSNFDRTLIYSISILTNWTEVDGLTYKVVTESSNVNISNCDNGEFATSPFNITATSAGTNITPRTKYNLAVCAVNADGGNSDPSFKLGVESGPSPPTNLRASSTTTNEIFVEWDDDDAALVHPVIQYTVYYKPIAGSTDDEQSIQTDAVAEDDFANRDKFITITGLQSNTEYTISVVSVTSNPIKTSDISSPTIGVTVPEQVSPPTSSNVTSSSFVLEWKEADEGTVDKTYTVACDSVDDNETRGRDEIGATLLQMDDLLSNAEYTCTVAAVNQGGSGLESSGTSVITVPSETKQTKLSSVPTNATTMLKVEWLKPDGGKEIDGYLVQWMNSSSGAFVDSHDEQHLKGNLQYSYTIENLTPGQTYDVSVQAYNSAKRGNPQTRTSTTIPEIIRGLISSQSSNSAHLLKLKWIVPVGTGDSIQITYSSTTTCATTANTLFPFTTIEGEIPVAPGNNYTVSVKTVSNGVWSREDESTKLQTNSKPSGIDDVTITPSSNDIALVWSLPSGFVEWIIIEFKNDNGPQKASLFPDETSYVISNVTNNTQYDITIYTTITNINGITEESERHLYSSALELPTPISEALIIGLSVGIAALVAILVVGIICFRRKKSTGKEYKGKVELKDFNDYMKSMSKMKITEEHKRLANVGEEQPTITAKSAINLRKNRYPNILPYDSNRVQLSCPINRIGGDYINASYIPGENHNKEYIAAQGPLTSTRDDFWRLVWEQNSRVIVMLVQSGDQVCDQYWPKNDLPMKVDDMSLLITSQLIKEEWIVRKLKLCKGSEIRRINQLQMTDWPDNGFPQSTDYLGRFVRDVRQVIERKPDAGPTIVHCSDGSSRSGTFIAIDRLLQQIERHSFVDIFGIVHELRMHRINMVAAQTQYILFYQTVQDEISKSNNIYHELDNADNVYASCHEQSVETAYENVMFQNRAAI